MDTGMDPQQNRNSSTSKKRAGLQTLQMNLFLITF